MARISYIGDAGEPLEIAIGPDNPDVMVGRHRTCGIRTANQSVSRQHARVFFDGESYWLQDNGSSNGTFYQNMRLEPQVPVQVDNAEFLMCGNFEMRFDFDEEDLARAAGGGYDDAYEEEAPPEEMPEEDGVESTRFADASDWQYEAPPPPPPPVAAAPPPLPSRPAPPPPPPPRRDPAPASSAGAPDAVVIEELRQALNARNRELEERDQKVHGLHIELESLSRRMEESQDEAQYTSMMNELEALRPLPDDLARVTGELQQAAGAASQLSAELQAAHAAIGPLQAEVAQLRADLDDTDARLQAAEGQGGSRAEDEAHIAQLEQELGNLRDSQQTAQEKFEEARAGRRNAEELANLQRMRAEGLEQGQKPLRDEVERLKAALATAAAHASDSVSPDEYDAQVAARDVAEENVHRLQGELAQVKAQLQKAQADTSKAQADVVAAQSNPAGGDSSLLEAEVSKLRMQLKAEKGRAAENQAELDRARSGGGSGSGGDGAASKAALQAKDAEIARLQAELAAKAAPAAASGGGAELEEQLARLRVQLKAEKTRTADLAAELDGARSAQLDPGTAQGPWQAAAEAAEAQVAELKQALAAAEQQAGGGGDEAAAVRAEADALRAQADKLTVTNRELEASASANMKRYQKLIKELDAARSAPGAGALSGGAGTGSGGGGAAAADGGADAARLLAVQAELAAAKSALAQAEARAKAAEAKASEAAAGSHGASNGAVDAVTRLVNDLNGVVSSFRNDFMTVTDAFEQIRSEDAEERDEGFEMLQEGLDACTTRNGELKNIIRDLKNAVGTD